jgi:glycerophosphoryl diester phosphodiesterase
MTVPVRAVQVAAAVVIAAGAAVALTIRFAFADRAAVLTHPRQPELFARSSGSPLAARGVFGVAHNAGDSVQAVSVAVARGANVVEIDVASSRGRLVAAHDRALPSLGLLQLRAPELEGIWKVAKRADAIEFDLKQSSPLFLEPLLTFLRSHRGPELIVATRSVSTLRSLRREAPWVVRFLSIGHPYQLERLRIDDSLGGLVQGVSVRESLLDARTTRWLKARHLVVLAWIVDEVRRARQLVKYGVDGIATNNLTMIESLGRQHRPDVLTALVGQGAG